MILAMLHLDVHFPACQSLKEKRAILQPMLQGLRRRWNVTALETDGQDLWQRSMVSAATLNTSRRAAEATLAQVARWVEGFCDAEIVSERIEWR